MLEEKFEEIFNTKPEYIFSAAGRVNLIGELDYCGGQVLPAALSLNAVLPLEKTVQILCALRRRRLMRVRKSI